MTTLRTRTAMLVAAAALVTLTGCLQLPGATVVPEQPEPATADPATSESVTGDDILAQFAGTSWSGRDVLGFAMEFTLDPDGTVSFQDWGGESFDLPQDTWSITDGEIRIYVSGIEDIGGITYTGAAQLGTMTLDGIDNNGDTGYAVTLVQNT